MNSGSQLSDLVELGEYAEVEKQGAKQGGKAAAKVDMVFHLTQNL